MERLPLAHGQRIQQLILDADQPLEGAIQHSGPFGGELDDVTPAVPRVSASDHKAALLQLVEKAHNITGIQPEHMDEILLRQVTALLQQREHK